MDQDPLQESRNAGRVMPKLILRGFAGALLDVLALGVAGGARAFDKAALEEKLGQIARLGAEQRVSCASLAAQRPVVVLAIGQSNAANHGVLASGAAQQVALVAEGQCILAADPLPGGTGRGASIWQRLRQYFSRLEPHRHVVLAVMGVDATSIEDWVGEKSPLGGRLENQVKSMGALDLLPNLVLWQQGEADARLGTTTAAYGAGLDKLAQILDKAGSNAPIVMARSTVCRSSPYAAVRYAVEAKAASNPRFLLGADTDTLLGADLRSDGCHFSAQGLEQAAQLWANTILQSPLRK